MSNPFWQLLVVFILLTSCQSNSLHNQNYINNDIKLTSVINDKTPNLKLLPFEAKNAQKNIIKAVKYQPSIKALKQQLSLLKANKKGALALKENQISQLDACVNFIKQFKKIKRVIIGVENSKQFLDIIKSFNKNQYIDFPKMSINQTKLINPHLWQ